MGCAMRSTCDSRFSLACSQPSEMTQNHPLDFLKSRNFDSQTKFNGCRFTGGNVLSCDGFGVALWTDSCLFDREAMTVIDAERVRAGQRAYSEEDLKNDIGHLIRKFVPKEAAGFRTVEEPNLIKGAISHSAKRDEIVEQFKKDVLDVHTISGVSEVGFHVRQDAKEALLHFAANGTFSGVLSTLYSALKKKLGV
jgi:hypothetical protein